MNTTKLEFTIPTYYTVLAFLEGTTPIQLLGEFVYYWCNLAPDQMMKDQMIE